MPGAISPLTTLESRAFEQARNGAFKLTSDLFESGRLLFEDCPLRPPGCSSLEILRMAIVDPTGDVFAVPGSSSR